LGSSRMMGWIITGCMGISKKMSGHSLKNTLNHVAAVICGGSIDVSPSGHLGEVERFIATDPILGELQKEYLDTIARYLSLLRLYGPNDIMVQMASDMAEAARATLDSRLSLLKARERAREKDAREEDMCALEKEKGVVGRQRSRESRQSEVSAKTAHDSFETMLLLWWMLRSATTRAENRLSIAMAFRQAAWHTASSLQSHSAHAA
jgi:hypothetical protein